MNYSNLFVRKNNDRTLNISYTKMVSDSLDVYNLEKISMNKVMSLYNPKYKDWFVAYRFKILREWFEKHINNENYEFQETLFNIIRNLNLTEYLNANEQNYLLNLKSKNFTRVRNIKSLMVDFKLNKNEKVYFHYRKLRLYSKVFKVNELDFYLSDERVVITFKNDVLSFLYQNISGIEFKNNSIIINYINEKYEFKTDKIDIIKISFETIYKMIKKEITWI